MRKLKLLVLMETKNPQWGFFGTTIQNYEVPEDVAHNVFGKVSHLISRECNISPERARCFLDSKNGRHFSDELSFHGAKKGMTETQLVRVAESAIKHRSWIRKAAIEQELF